MSRAPAFITENAARFDDAEPRACVLGCPIHSSMPCEGCRFNYALVQHLRLRALYARRPLLKDRAVLYFSLVLFYAAAGFLVIAFVLLFAAGRHR